MPSPVVFLLCCPLALIGVTILAEGLLRRTPGEADDLWLRPRVSSLR